MADAVFALYPIAEIGEAHQIPAYDVVTQTALRDGQGAMIVILPSRCFDFISWTVIA